MHYGCSGNFLERDAFCNRLGSSGQKLAPASDDMGVFIRESVPDPCPVHPASMRSAAAHVACGHGNDAVGVLQRMGSGLALIPMVPLVRLRMDGHPGGKRGVTALTRGRGAGLTAHPPVQIGTGLVQRLTSTGGGQAQVGVQATTTLRRSGNCDLRARATQLRHARCEDRPPEPRAASGAPRRRSLQSGQHGGQIGRSQKRRGLLRACRFQKTPHLVLFGQQVGRQRLGHPMRGAILLKGAAFMQA